MKILYRLNSLAGRTEINIANIQINCETIGFTLQKFNCVKMFTRLWLNIVNMCKIVVMCEKFILPLHVKRSTTIVAILGLIKFYALDF